MTRHPRLACGRIRMGGAAFVAAVLIIVADPHSTHAQQTQTALIVGRVTEADGPRPIAGVSVRLDDVRSALSDDDGIFSFEAVPLGTHSISIDHLSFAPVRDSLVLREAGATYELEIGLSTQPVALAPIVVTVHSVGGPLEDVEDRMARMRRLGLGEIFDRAAIERSGTSRVSHLVAQVPGARLQPVRGRAGASELRLQARNDCQPSFYMDGRRVELYGAPLDDFVALSDVAFVEVYRRLSALPMEFADEQSQNCGVVAVWTRRGDSGGGKFGVTRMLTATTFAAVVLLIARVWCC